MAMRGTKAEKSETSRRAVTTQEGGGEGGREDGAGVAYFPGGLDKDTGGAGRRPRERQGVGEGDIRPLLYYCFMQDYIHTYT
jgi:hypothetical protein